MSDIKHISFGHMINRERKNREWSLKELSDRMDNCASPSYLNRLEKNQKENPSFSLVCSLIEALELDLREVVKNFGFGEILDNSHEEVNTIEALVRLFNIQTPLNTQGNFQYLNHGEKESLIKIVNLVLKYVVAIEDKGISNIVAEIEKFRRVRAEIVNKVDFDEIQVEDYFFTVKWTSKALEFFDRSKLSRNVILDLIVRLNTRIFDLQGVFTVTDEENDITLFCERDTEGLITILEIKNNEGLQFFSITDEGYPIRQNPYLK